MNIILPNPTPLGQINKKILIIDSKKVIVMMSKKKVNLETAIEVVAVVIVA